MHGRAAGMLTLLAVVGLFACFASSAALALVPTSGQTLANGTVVEGKCKSSVGAETGAGEQWTLNTDDPQRIQAPAGTTLAPMSIPPSLVPFGDFQLAGEATGAHSHIFPLKDYENHEFDPRFSAKWGWHYLDQWAVNFQGGSDGATPASGGKSCAEEFTEDTSAADHPNAPLGSYAGGFPGESVAQGHGLRVQRPGPYAVDQWTLKIHYKKVVPAEFKAHPFLPTSCPEGTAVLNQNAIKEAEEKGESVESESVKAQFIYLKGMEADYRVAGPAPESEWKAETYCLEGFAIPFVVDGAHGQGSFSGDMSQWPTSPYINQYAAGTHIGLPGAAHDSRPGATASGPSSLLMGMRAVVGASKPLPGLKSVYEQTVDSHRDFAPEPALKLLKELGWAAAVSRPLGASSANVADAGPPYPIGYPNAANEATIDQALQNGPVALDTELGTDEWGRTGGGHVILIIGIDPQQPGSYIVDDPAGNYFASPTGHYGSGSYGYGVDYPKAWVLAYATNSGGRGLIEFGPHTGDPAVIDISDAQPGTSSAPTSFYLQNAAGQRTGWINGQAVNEIANSFAGENTPWSQDVAGGEMTPESEPAGPYRRFLLVPEPTTDMTLHVVPGSGGKYSLLARAGENGEDGADDQLQGSSPAGQDTVVPSPALQSIATAPLPPTEPKSSTTTTTTTGSTLTTTPPTPTPTNIVAAHILSRLSAAQIRALLRRQITPTGRLAGIASLKKRGGFTLSFHSGEAGVVTVSWYELPRGARLTTKTKPKPVLVARGRLSFSAAATRPIAIRLTMAGAQLLKQSRQLALTASGSFAPRGAAAVTATRAFVLK
jgi:hypothetical protein